MFLTVITHRYYKPKIEIFKFKKIHILKSNYIGQWLNNINEIIKLKYIICCTVACNNQLIN